MSFNSYFFILVFFPVVFIGYYLFLRWQRYSVAKLWLLGMSLWFYAYFHFQYLIILVGSIVGNYSIYLGMNWCRKREAVCRTKYPAIGKGLLFLGICGNIGILVIYKYFDFFVENVNHWLGVSVPVLKLLMPLGISFFTFQQIGFLIDAGRNHEAVKYSFLDYGLFVSFFPQLVAGPIVAHEEFIPQLTAIRKRKWSWDSVALGILFFVIGLSKKILLADIFGRAVNYGFTIYKELSAGALILVAFAFVIQIYFDFSGYSDMARGLGMMLQFELPINFDSPFKANNITEFWKRWHITLSKFLTKYVYYPCGGSRRGKLCQYRNLMLVFGLSGLWHGANWTYLVWGMLNGLASIVERITRRWMIKVPKVLGQMFTFVFFAFTMIYFRATDIRMANDYLMLVGTGIKSGSWKIPLQLAQEFQTDEFWYLLKIFHLTGYAWSGYILMVGYFAVAWGLIWWAPSTEQLRTYWKKEVIDNECGTASVKGMWLQSVMTAIAISGLLLWCVLSFSEVSTFLYFNF